MSGYFQRTTWGRNVLKALLKPRQKNKSYFETNKWNIVRGDKVEVINGPQTGQRGEVLKVLRKENRVIVNQVNMVIIYFNAFSMLRFDF